MKRAGGLHGQFPRSGGHGRWVQSECEAPECGSHSRPVWKERKKAPVHPGSVRTAAARCHPCRAWGLAQGAVAKEGRNRAQWGKVGVWRYRTLRDAQFIVLYHSIFLYVAATLTAFVDEHVQGSSQHPVLCQHRPTAHPPKTALATPHTKAKSTHCIRRRTCTASPPAPSTPPAPAATAPPSARSTQGPQTPACPGTPAWQLPRQAPAGGSWSRNLTP